MNIKIILPACYAEDGKLFRASKAIVPNLTIIYLASLVPSQHAVSVVEETVGDINFDDPVDLVGLSVNTSNADRAYEVASKYRRKGVKVVIGGIHATCVPHEAAQYADAVVIGEAEDSWPQLIGDFENGRMKKIYEGSRRESLEQLPHPRFDLIDYSKYVRIPFRQSPIIPIQTSRGCPYNCEFCLVTRFWGHKLRYRPIEDVIKEIKISKADTFFFTDDNFCSNHERTKEFCNAAIPLRIKYICQVDTSIHERPELIELMANSGCIMCYIGFESLSKNNLRKMKKAFNKPEDYGYLLNLFHGNNINVYASIIFGFDNDTPELVMETVDFLIKHRVSLSAFFPLSPSPGSSLYERLKVENRLTDEQWWLKRDYATRFIRIKYAENQYSGVELAAMAIRQFYSYKSILRRFASCEKNRLFPFLMNMRIGTRAKKSLACFL